MKKKSIAFVMCVLIAVSLISCSKKSSTTGTAPSNQIASTVETSSKLKDGTYKAETEPDYEGYFEKAEVTIKDGKITEVNWGIYDSARNNKPFDEKYEEVFAGNEEYMEQSRNDWNGSRDYGPKLIDIQDLNKVDSVSGATWTYNKFKQVVQIALDNAK